MEQLKGRIGYVWGIGGVALVLVDALLRLTPIAVDAFSQPLSWVQWSFLLGWLGFMGFVEGYRGFHLSFSPRVLVRARYLRQNPRWLDVALAPLFCSSLFRTTRRRLIASWGMVAGIVSVVLLVRTLAQPWRGLVDLGVVAGLSAGLASMAVWLVRERLGHTIPFSPELGELDGEREKSEARGLSQAPTP